jgi:hypothetical protein
MHDEMTLAAEFGAWHIWRGRSGSGKPTDWNATLKGRSARRAAVAAGRMTRLTAADAAALRALLGQQENLRERAA